MRGTAYRVLCAIGGLDPTGGAGLVADIETFGAHGFASVAVASASTAQGATGVRHIRALPATDVSRALLCALEARSPEGLKIGMVAKAATARALQRVLSRAHHPLVVADPVLRAGAGGRLLEAGALPALRALLAKAHFVTPNLPEALALLGKPPSTRIHDPMALARELHRRLAGPLILLKGGHATGETVVDVLVGPGLARRYAHGRLLGPSLHGTGCTLASALLARLAQGADPASAAEGAIAYVCDAIRLTHQLGGWCLVRPEAAPGS